MWEYLARPGASDRVASFTSVSGPSGDHINRFIIGGLKRPYRPRRFMRALSQLLRLSYMGAFSIPVLAPLVVRPFLAGLLRRSSARRHPAEQVHHSETYKTDAANSLKVYRRQLLPHARIGQADHYVDVPVQVIVNTKDPFVRPYVYADTTSGCRGCGAATSRPATGRRCRTRDDRAVGARTRRLPRGQAGEPGAAARAGRPSARILRRHTGFRDRSGQRYRARDRARVRPRGRRSGDQRHRRGRRQGDRRADRRRGGVAHAYTLDVADAEAVERFAEQVCAEHGVPDIVVNNAGVGQAGLFLDTPARSTTGSSTSTSAEL